MYDGQLILGGGLNELPGMSAQAARAEAFYKALTTDYTTDHAALTGAGALKRESLESSIISVEQRAKHFVFYNKLPKGRATAVIDEWTKEHGVGGIPGSSANTEIGTIPLHEGVYDREIARVKFLMDRRGVPGVAEIQAANGLGSLIAKETDKGSRKLLTDANYLSWYGKAAAIPAQFDGFVALMEAVGGDQVIDLHGASISADGTEILKASALIWGQDHWGMATDVFCSGEIKKDFNVKLFNSLRAMVGENSNPAAYTTGANVRAIATEFGENERLVITPDPFIQESQALYAARGGAFATQLTASLTTALVSVAGVAAPYVGSKFDTDWDGDYYYAVQPTRKEGDAAAVKSAAVTVAVGDGVTLTITPNAGNNATGYRIFRGRRNGTNADADLREVALVAANGDVAVTYVDYNQTIPGTSFMAVVTLREEALSFQRMADAFRFPLFPTDTFMHLWAQIMLGYLRMAKTEQHVLIKNVLPTSAAWNPQG